MSTKKTQRREIVRYLYFSFFLQVTNVNFNTIPDMGIYLKIAGVLVLVYLAILLCVFSIQTKLIFHPAKLPQDYRFGAGDQATEVLLTTPDHVKISGLFFAAQNDKVILYLHGNAGALDTWQYVYQEFQAIGYNFLIIDYRGYGKSTGEISENGLYSDAQTAYEYLVKRGFPENKIIVIGRSIGTGVAVNLAMNKNINALILESPLGNFKQLVTDKLPFLLPSIYIKYEFDNLGKINGVRSPLLIIHGKDDDIIPYKEGKRLYEIFRGKKKMLSIEGGSHNNLDEFPEVSQGITSFLSFTKP